MRVYAPNNTSSKYLRQKGIKLQGNDKYATITEDCNTPVSILDMTGPASIKSVRI